MNDGGGQGGGISDPDWDRYKVNSRATNTSPGAKLGLPLRWGARINTQVPAAFVETATEQFLRVQTDDTYSRSWSLLGTLRLPQVTWTVVVAPFPLAVLLEVTQGVGQATIVQNIVLAVGGSPTAGLCNTQHVNNGGPYFSQFSGPGGIFETRPFAAIGALIGNAIAIRARYVGFPPFTGLPDECVLDAIVTPYAAGQGL